MRTALVWLAAVTVAVPLVGCLPSTGVVVEHRRVLVGKVLSSRICVRDTAGHVDCQLVHRETFDACPVGARWPDCTTTPRRK